MVTFAPQLYAREGIDGVRRRQVVAVLQAALDAVDPAAAIRRYLRREDDTLIVDGQPYDLTRYANIYVVGAGKASALMAQAVEGVLEERISRGHVNVKYAHALPTRWVQLHEAGHPIPDAAGVAGAQQIADLLRGATENDLVLCLISGGGSALMTLPGVFGHTLP